MNAQNDDAKTRRGGDAKTRRTSSASRTSSARSRQDGDTKGRRDDRAEHRTDEPEDRYDGDAGAAQDRDAKERPAPTTVGIADVVVHARRTMAALTGHAVDSVTSARRSKDGWQVRLELVELERVPATTSVLGSYEVTLDGDGELLEYGRIRRYYRNQASGDDEE